MGRLFIVCLTLFVVPLMVGAQFESNGFLKTNVSLESNPLYPNPNEPVTITLNDYGGTVYGAAITWSINGTARPEFQNNRSITIESGAAGAQTVVRATLSLPGGRTETLTQTIAPNYLDIIVEPQTHVPSFYLGRALPSVGSTLSLTALTHTGVAPSSLIYTWKINDEVFEAGPLRGRNKISFVAPLGSTMTIAVQVTSLTGEVLASRIFEIPTTNPVLHFYEVNSLYGIEYRSMAESLTLIGNSTTLQAEPYYLDSRVYNNPDILEWRIDRVQFPGNNDNPYTITVEKTGAPGSATVDFHVRSTTALLQGGKESITIAI